MRASYWGRRGCFDLLLRAGALAIGGQRYGPDRAYIDTASARGFLEVTGVPLTASTAEWCEAFILWWSDHWDEVAALAGGGVLGPDAGRVACQAGSLQGNAVDGERLAGLGAPR